MTPDDLADTLIAGVKQAVAERGPDERLAGISLEKGDLIRAAMRRLVEEEMDRLISAASSPSPPLGGA